MIEHQEFWAKELPIILNEDMRKVLDSGIIYIHGRDKWFRPIMVYNWGIFNDIDVNLDNALQASLFSAFYMMENLLMAGKVENWNVINNLDNLAVSKIPIKFLKTFLKVFQANLKWRGRAFLVLKVTWPIRALWKMLSPFVDERVKNKITMTKDHTHENLLNNIHPSQLEKKFGGEADNLTDFWPPREISSIYGHDEDLINWSQETEQIEESEANHHSKFRISPEVAIRKQMSNHDILGSEYKGYKILHYELNISNSYID